MAASVSAEAFLPTGPAATEASAPIFTLLERTDFAPFWFITSRTKSVASPPTCKPKLPPSSAIIDGAPQEPLKSAGPARHRAAPVTSGDDEARLLNGREHDHAIRFVQKRLRHSFRRADHFLNHVRCVGEALIFLVLGKGARGRAETKGE